jgi:hypothetical protein
LLENRPLEVDAVVQTIGEFASLYDVSEEGPWVFGIPEPLVRQLAAVDDQRAVAIVDAWAATEEFVLDGWDRDSVRSILDALRGLARDAAAQQKSLLMWSCL